MFNPEDMTDELRNALIHSGIDDPDDYLAHYGVEGMRWGRRKTDRQQRLDGGGRIATLKTKNGKPIVSVVKRTPTVKLTVAKRDSPYSKAKVKREKIRAANEKAYNDPQYKQSSKTKKLGNAATIASLATIGSAGINILSKQKLGAGGVFVTAALAATTITLDALQDASENKDNLKKYGE